MNKWFLFSRCVRLIWQAAPQEMVKLALMNTVTGLSPSLLAYLGAVLVDRCARFLKEPDPTSGLLPFLQSNSDLLWILGVMVVLNVWLDAMMALEGFNLDTMRDKIKGKVHLLLMQKISSVHELTLFESPKFARNLKLTEKALQKLTQLSDTLSYCVIGALGLGSIVILLGQVAWWVPLVIVSATFPAIRVQGQLEDLSWAVEEKHAENSRKMDVLQNILTRAEYAKDVRIYRYQRPLEQRWKSIFGTVLQDMLKVRHASAYRMLGWAMVSGTGTIGPLVYVLWRVVQGSASVGQLAFLVSAIFQIRRNLSVLIFQGGDILSILNHVQPLFQVLDHTSEIPEGHQDPGHIHTLELKGVNFTYPQAQQPSLKNIHFTFEKGKSYALVGQNGAGKTTLVKLLLQFYVPSAGSLHINGVPASHFRLPEVLERIAAVFQDHARFPLEVQSNLSPDALEASKAAALLSELNLLLPFEQSLDREEEGGIDLSGGQWQKLAIARAEYKSDVDVVVLDEPTAALDPIIEHEVFEVFQKMVKDKMGIIVSHRLSLTRFVDTILVLHDGEVIEQGSHLELLALKGHYARMFDLQSRAYVG